MSSSVNLRSCLFVYRWIPSEWNGTDIPSRDRALHGWHAPTVSGSVASQRDTEATSLQSADLLTADVGNIMWRSTDFLRHVLSEKRGRGAVTSTYVCQHCKLFPVEVLWWGANRGEQKKINNISGWWCGACGMPCGWRQLNRLITLQIGDTASAAAAAHELAPVTKETQEIPRAVQAGRGWQGVISRNHSLLGKQRRIDGPRMASHACVGRRDLPSLPHSLSCPRCPLSSFISTLHSRCRVRSSCSKCGNYRGRRQLILRNPPSYRHATCAPSTVLVDEIWL